MKVLHSQACFSLAKCCCTLSSICEAHPHLLAIIFHDSLVPCPTNRSIYQNILLGDGVFPNACLTFGRVDVDMYSDVCKQQGGKLEA